jgi:carboxyl-terminal processing protease
MQKRSFFFITFLFLVAFSLGWQLGVQMERQNQAVDQRLLEERFALTGSGATYQQDPEEEVDMTILWTVWRLLDRHYVDPSKLTIDEMRFGAVRGLVGSIGDAYSSFMTPKESTDFQQVLRGKLEGIGAELTYRDGVIVVVAPLKGSPASAAGLLPLDVITGVDGESMKDASLQDAVMRIRGEKGTEVILTVFRPSEGEELDIPITRDEIRVPSVEHEVLETGSGTVGYVALNQFGDSAVPEIREALQQLKKEELEGLILDLRFNGGGYLDGAIDIASFFLTKGKIVSVDRRGQEIASHYAFGSPIVPDIPLVVLINEGSASASEIVAGALQDHGRAYIIGAKSFGKGTVQEVLDLPGGSSLRVTVAKWLTPNGRDLSIEGVVPDLAVEMTTEQFVDGDDPQKEAALEYLLDGEES